MKQINAYMLDLTKIAGNGVFRCPKCGVKMSPDDETEEVYSIIETELKGQFLQELVIQCNRCTSQIHLMGFALLQKLHK